MTKAPTPTEMSGQVIVLRRISDYGYITAPFSRLLRHAGDTEDVFST